MSSDRAFSVYALTLIAIIAAVLAASVQTGIATPPTAGVFLAHLALSVGLRAAYHSFGGFDWLYEFADALGLYERTVARVFASEANAA